MRVAVVVPPCVNARGGVELPSEGAEGVELASGVQGSKHRATCDMVERAYSINREDGGAWACFGGSAE